MLALDGPTLPNGRAVYAFPIDIFGAEFAAACSLPTGWELKSEKYEDRDSYVSGKADLHASRLRFNSMYLVDVYDYRAATRRKGRRRTSRLISGLGSNWEP